MTPVELQAAQQAVLAVHAGEALLDYLQALIAATAAAESFVEGLSPRAGIAVLRAAKARALMDCRDLSLPTTSRPFWCRPRRTVCSPCRGRAAAQPSR